MSVPINVTLPAVRVLRRAAACSLIALCMAAPASAGHFPMYAAWAQPDGPGSALTLTYSFSNLLDGSLLDSATGAPLPVSLLRSAFELALWDYAAVLPIHFVEVSDSGPPPETGEYDPTGLADIRVGQVAHIADANAYAYFPALLSYEGPVFPLDETTRAALQGVYGAGVGSVTPLSPVPEPGASALMLAGLIVLRARTQRRTSRGSGRHG